MVIKISSAGVTGEVISGIHKIVNLSSCLPDVLQIMLSRISTLPETISMVDFTHPIMYSIRENELLRVPRRKSVIAVVDGDDSTADIKIRALKQFTNIRVADRIIFVKSNKSNMITNKIGSTRILCNPHHTEKMQRSLGVISNTMHNPSEIALVVIVKTTDCYISSINGLIACVEYYKLPYRIEERQTKLGVTWMMLTKKQFEDKYDLAYKTRRTTSDPATKRRWQKSVGYMTYMTTEQGPKEVVLRKTHESWMRKVLKWLMTKVTYIIKVLINKIKEIYDYVIKTWLNKGKKKKKYKTSK